MSVARFAFGPRLKAHRERQGITLKDIADSTKIGISLLSSLERNDVSQWPKGIFRRAFLRSYTRAIDIPFEPVWIEFSQLFPEDGSAPTLAHVSHAPPMRLTLDTGARRRVPHTRNLIAAAADSGVVATLGLTIAWLTSLTAWTSLALTGIVYLAASTALAGGSLSLKYLSAWRTGQVAAPADDDPVIAQPAQPDQSAASAERPRPRIFAVAPMRTTPSSDVRERRVADR
jgi:transcriptional regulator with XRE-family HTH domain